MKVVDSEDGLLGCEVEMKVYECHGFLQLLIIGSKFQF